MTLNIDVPHFNVFVRAQFLYNRESHFGQLIPGIVFGVSSITNRALGFHVMLNNGAVFWRLPIHAFVWKEIEYKQLNDVSQRQLWDNISYNITVNKFEFLKDKECNVFLDNKQLKAKYMFTVDYYNSEYSESPDQHKCSHILMVEDGTFASQPNNRILWLDKSWVKPPKERPDYKINTYIDYCEDSIDSVTENNYIYQVNNEKDS